MENRLLYGMKHYNKHSVWERLWYDDVYRIKVAGIILGIALTFIGLWYIIIYRGYTYMRVEETNWELKIALLQYQTIQESGWHVPVGGRITDSKWEIRTYERYISGYETVTVRGSSYNCGTSKKPKTCRHPDTTKTEPKYSTRPVYDTKYYYDIDRWVNIQPLITSGNDKELVEWPNTTGYTHNAPDVIGNIRLGQRISHFWLVGTGDNGKKYSLDMDETKWRQYWKGKRAKLTLGFFGNVIEVK